MSNNQKKKFYGINDELWGHKWGYKDSSFIINDDNSVTFTGNRYEGISGERLPYLIPFVTKVLDTEIKKEPYFKEVKKMKKNLNKNVMKVFDVRNSVNLKVSYGGTSFDNIKKMILSYKKK